MISIRSRYAPAMYISPGRAFVEALLGRLPGFDDATFREFMALYGVDVVVVFPDPHYDGRFIRGGSRLVKSMGVWDGVVVLASLYHENDPELTAIATTLLVCGRAEVVE